MTKKDFFLGLLKGLIIAYLMTFVLLAVLAFAMYKFRWGEQPVNIGIVLIYVLSSAICGFVAGGHVQARRFLWGLFAGLVYAFVLLLVAVIIGKDGGTLLERMPGPLLLCLAGGMIGGMFR